MTLQNGPKKLLVESLIPNTFTGKLKTFDEAVDEAAAWYIRNTYPTYSKVPEVIQNIKKVTIW